MIVTCPACATRYRIDEAALSGSDGRRLRCASCGHAWHFSPEPAVAPPEPPIAGEALAAVARLRVEPDAEPRPSPLGPALGPALGPTSGASAMPRPSVAVEPAVPARDRGRTSPSQGRSWRWGDTLGLLVLLALVALVAVVLLDRDDIIAKWPQAAPIYAKLHLAEAPPGSGLDVSVTPTRTADALLINGDIVNRTGQSRRIPRLRITLRDGNSADVASKIIDPPVESLAAGATAHFSTTFDHPSSNATGTVAVTFAE